jgi:hypothetical protein
MGRRHGSCWELRHAAFVKTILIRNGSLLMIKNQGAAIIMTRGGKMKAENESKYEGQRKPQQ